MNRLSIFRVTEPSTLKMLNALNTRLLRATPHVSSHRNSDTLSPSFLEFEDVLDPRGPMRINPSN